jgi:hypothetical protein
MKNNIEQQQNGRLQTGLSSNRRFSLRPWLLLAVGAIGLLAAGSAHAQATSPFPLPFYEPFPSSANPYNGFGYANDEELGVAGFSGLVWTFGNGVSSSCARPLNTNGQSGLEYPGLVNVDAIYQTGLLATYLKDLNSVKNRGVNLIIPTNNPSAPMELYASFLLNLQTNTFISANNPSPILGLTANSNASASSVNQSGGVVYINENLQLQISKNSTTTATNLTQTLVSNNTYLIVLRYKFNTTGPGTNADSVDLWIDPTALGSNVVVPTPTISTTNNNNVASNFFGGVGFFELPNPCNYYLDEIRVATNWGGVTPTNTPAGNIYSVTGGGAGCGNTAFDVGLSGSDTGLAYYLYSDGIEVTNASGPIEVNGTGSAISFGPQTLTALYTVVASNATTFNQSWMSGGASVSILSPPTITSQPLPLTVPSGELGAFGVASTGGGQTYQWYKGGVALADTNEFSGVQSSNLVIFPVTSQDVATAATGYYVLIGNACGTLVSSVTNSLTLGTPANLTWYGDGILDLWDVGISMNWDTDTAFFNYGDNVTFDDTSPNPNVTLNNNFLSPSTITINGSANAYVFSGPGGLAGDGSIVMNSANTLTLNLGLVNTESGGIVISNGTLIFSAFYALGTGPITLAGGQLEAGPAGLVTIDNSIDVTSTNSTISTAATGGQPLVITNTITGTSGDLTFLNTANKNGAPLIELMAPFTFGLPVTLNPGTSALGIVVSGNNTDGSQIWNDYITGGGEMERNGAGGDTILNATNNYTGGTELESGSLGVGIDSVAPVPPTIVAGPLGTGTLFISTAGTAPALFASGGPHILANPIAWTTNVPGPAFIINGSESLDLTGTIDLFGTNRTLEVDNTAATVQAGGIMDSSGDDSGLTLTGLGALYLEGTNTYGATTNASATLSGSGILGGLVVVQTGATLGAGTPAAIGTLTIDSSLILGGNLFIRVNNSPPDPLGIPPVTNDNFIVTDGATNIGSGTVTVSNVGPALAVGNKFVLFNGPVVGGAALTVSGGGVTWQNNLAANGSISVLTILPPPAPPSPGINAVSASAGNLVFSGTNGTVGGTYYILTTTNITLPLSDWTVLSTNTFGAGGVFSASIPIGASADGHFYSLEVP